MKESILIANLTWTEYAERIQGGRRVVFLPIGSLEQHGYHMSMNADVLIPTGISKLVARRVDGLVAPAVCYGYKSQPKSGGGNHFPGTTSLDARTLTLTVRDVLKEFARHGVRKIAVMNGHYENSMFIIEGIDVALRELCWGGIDDFKVVFLSYWEFVKDPIIEHIYPDGFPGWGLEHAGLMETSIMLSLHPELVDMTKVEDHPPANFPPYDVYPVNPDWVPSSGSLSSPKLASKEKGDIFIDACVMGIVAAIQTEFDLKLK